VPLDFEPSFVSSEGPIRSDRSIVGRMFKQFGLQLLIVAPLDAKVRLPNVNDEFTGTAPDL
jgi:hypothetical protein